MTLQQPSADDLAYVEAQLAGWKTMPEEEKAAIVGGMARNGSRGEPRRPGRPAPPVRPANVPPPPEPDHDPGAEPTDLVPAEPPGDGQPVQKNGLTADEEEKFWTSHPALTHIRTAARAREASPWAVLVVILIRLMSYVPPKYTLPAVVGHRIQGNIFAGLVGMSGQGKNMAEGVARDVVAWPVRVDVNEQPVELVGDKAFVNMRTLGTGEGIYRNFVEEDGDAPGKWRMAEWSVVINESEVSKFEAVAKRQGSTLPVVVRKGCNGEALGNSNFSKEFRVEIDEFSYRLGFILGVQPENAKWLFGPEEMSGGTPQRFVFAPCNDPYAPDVSPAWPGALTWDGRPWSMPAWPVDLVPFWTEEANGERFHDVYVCETAAAAIKATRKVANRRDIDAALTPEEKIAGHATRNREAWAFAFDLLFGKVGVFDDGWEAAGTLMKVSAATIRLIMRARGQADAEVNRGKGRAQGERDVIAAKVREEADDEDLRAVCAAILKKLRTGADGDGWVSGRDLTKMFNSSSGKRKLVPVAVEMLEETGQVQQEETSSGRGGSKGYRVRLTDGG